MDKVGLLKKPTSLASDVGVVHAFVLGCMDLFETLKLWRLWTFWGWLDVRQRYRRSLLGPFWVTATMAISVLATGLVYAYLFKQNVKDYLPYVATGYVLWSLISGFVGEACSVFISNEGFIGQLKLPYLVYPFRLLWRYFTSFLHHLLVLLIVVLLFTPVSFNSVVGFCLGLLVLCLNIFWMGLLLGLFSVRLRDLPVLMATVFQLLFLVTPVMWPASALGARAEIAEYNPFFHLLESVRGPLLNPGFPLLGQHLMVSLIMAVLGLLITLVVYSKWNRRMSYWL